MVPSTSCYTPSLSSGRRDGCGARIIDLGRTYGAPGAAGAVRWAHAARAARCHGVVEELGVCLVPWGKWGFKPWNIRGFSQHFQTKPEIPTGNLSVYYIENGHLVRWFTLIYLLKMVIFHSYGSLPEGAQNSLILNGRMIIHWILRYPIFSQTHAEARGFCWFLGIWQGLEHILIKHHPTKKGI